MKSESTFGEELANDLAMAWMNKGSARSNEGLLGKAIEAYDQAIRIYEPLVKTRPELANNLAAA